LELSAASSRFPPFGSAEMLANFGIGSLVADQTVERMLGYKAITAGIAGPEIADDVVSQIG
jgi:hypothetical protein